MIHFPFVVLVFLLNTFGSVFAEEVINNPGYEINKSFPLKPAENETVYKSYLIQNLQGIGAKYVIAGRILNDSSCDVRRFDMARVNEIVKFSSENIDFIELIKRGKGDAISLSKLPFYCEFLYFEAANWSMTYPLTATKNELAEITMLTAAEQNNCNWDDETNSEKNIFPEINDTSQQIAGIKLVMMSTIYNANSVEVLSANNEGLDLGLEPNIEKLKLNCIKIRDFAKNIK